MRENEKQLTNPHKSLHFPTWNCGERKTYTKINIFFSWTCQAKRISLPQWDFMKTQTFPPFYNCRGSGRSFLDFSSWFCWSSFENKHFNESFYVTRQWVFHQRKILSNFNTFFPALTNKPQSDVEVDESFKNVLGIKSDQIYMQIIKLDASN